MKQVKKCTGKCGKMRPIQEFGKRDIANDGRNSECSECLRERQTIIRREKKVIINAFI